MTIFSVVFGFLFRFLCVFSYYRFLVCDYHEVGFCFRFILLFGCAGSLLQCATSSLQHTAFSSCSTWLSCVMACGILVLGPVIKPASSTLEGRFSTTWPPRKSLPWGSGIVVSLSLYKHTHTHTHTHTDTYTHIHIRYILLILICCTETMHVYP